MSRMIIFTGKGGVGKTSVAAAHARLSAREGKKTLLISTDMAHNLGDLFGCSIGGEEKEIADNLYALEVNPSDMMENEYANLLRAILNMLHSKEAENASSEEGIMIPGMDELFSLLKLLDIYQSQRYERIIVDCAPTGETLSLLKFPELLCWYMEKFFPVGKIAVRLLSPVSKRIFKVELPDREAMSDIEKLYMKMIHLQELLKNKDAVSVRLVTMPEKMVVEETKRNYMYLNLYGYYVDGVYINRILPEDMDNSFFRDWIHIQKIYTEEIKSVFQGIPMFSIPWYERDLCGMDAIDRICDEVLQGHPIFSIMEHRAQEQYEKTDSGYCLSLYLPCLTKEELNLYQSGTDVIIKVGNFKRNITMPDVLRSYRIVSAKIEEQILIIHFEKEERKI